MRKTFTVIALTLSLGASAQNIVGGCGTITPPHELEKIYDFVQHNSAAYHRGTAGITDSIPLSIHIVGKDDGSGYYSVKTLFSMLCRLNERYIPTGYHFYIKWPLDYINNTAYYVHVFAAGDRMMQENNIPNSANIYFVQDPAGACGYYTYGQDAVAIGNNCASAASTTLAHELGHYFSLPHTFSGWESGTPSDPENVSRTGPYANCNSSGDGFCDTEADYIASRWTCNPSPVGRLDAVGDTCHLDSSVYMSYSLDACQSRFSDQQIAAMQYDLHVDRQNYPGNVIPRPRTLDTARTIYPTSTLFANFKTAIWHRVAGADYYYVTISYQSSPSTVLQSALVADTTWEITHTLADGGRYLVNINPVNAHNFCMDYKTAQPFTYSSNDGVLAIPAVNSGDQGINVYPNPAAANGLFSIELKNLPAGKYAMSIISINGQLCSEQIINHAGGNIAYPVKMGKCTPGVYVIRCKGAKAQYVQRLFIQP